MFSITTYVITGKSVYNLLVVYLFYKLLAMFAASLGAWKWALLASIAIVFLRYYTDGLVFALTCGHFLYSLVRFLFGYKDEKRPRKTAGNSTQTQNIEVLG